MALLLAASLGVIFGMLVTVLALPWTDPPPVEQPDRRQRGRW